VEVFYKWLHDQQLAFVYLLSCSVLTLYAAVRFIMSLTDRRSSRLFFLLSPVIRELLDEALLTVYAKALETPNKWDDLCVKTIMFLVGTNVPGEDVSE
jgi:hypothetical protein